MKGFFHSPAGLLLRVWTAPRLVIWIPAMTAIIAVLHGFPARWPYAVVIPHFLWLDPGVAAIPLAGIFAGPAGVWAAAAGTGLGDMLAGQWGVMSGWRITGAAFWALSAHALWDATLWPESDCCAHRPRWGQSFRFLWSAWPGALAAAVWTALGADLNRLYPFPYILTILTLHHTGFAWMLGIAFYRMIARELMPHTGTWRALSGLKESDAPVSMFRASLLLCSMCGAATGGLIYARIAYRLNPFEIYVLGVHTGRGLLFAVLPFLLLAALGFLWPAPHRTLRD